MGNPIYVPPCENKQRSYIQLRVKDPRGMIVQFKMRRRLPLGILQDFYCQRENLDLSLVEFTYKGKRVALGDTPDELQMSDTDLIDVCYASTTEMLN